MKPRRGRGYAPTGVGRNANPAGGEEASGPAPPPFVGRYRPRQRGRPPPPMPPSEGPPPRLRRRTTSLGRVGSGRDRGGHPMFPAEYPGFSEDVPHVVPRPRRQSQNLSLKKFFGFDKSSSPQPEPNPLRSNSMTLPRGAVIMPVDEPSPPTRRTRVRSKSLTRIRPAHSPKSRNIPNECATEVMTSPNVPVQTFPTFHASNDFLGQNATDVPHEAKRRMSLREIDMEKVDPLDKGTGQRRKAKQGRLLIGRSHQKLPTHEHQSSGSPKMVRRRSYENMIQEFISDSDEPTDQNLTNKKRFRSSTDLLKSLEAAEMKPMNSRVKSKSMKILSVHEISFTDECGEVRRSISRKKTNSTHEVLVARPQLESRSLHDLELLDNVHKTERKRSQPNDQDENQSEINSPLQVSSSVKKAKLKRNKTDPSMMDQEIDLRSNEQLIDEDGTPLRVKNSLSSSYSSNDKSPDEPSHYIQTYVPLRSSGSASNITGRHKSPARETKNLSDKNAFGFKSSSKSKKSNSGLNENNKAEIEEPRPLYRHRSIPLSVLNHVVNEPWQETLEKHKRMSQHDLQYETSEQLTQNQLCGTDVLQQAKSGIDIVSPPHPEADNGNPPHPDVDMVSPSHSDVYTAQPLHYDSEIVDEFLPGADVVSSTHLQNEHFDEITPPIVLEGSRKFDNEGLKLKHTSGMKEKTKTYLREYAKPAEPSASIQHKPSLSGLPLDSHDFEKGEVSKSLSAENQNSITSSQHGDNYARRHQKISTSSESSNEKSDTLYPLSNSQYEVGPSYSLSDRTEKKQPVRLIVLSDCIRASGEVRSDIHLEEVDNIHQEKSSASGYQSDNREKGGYTNDRTEIETQAEPNKAFHIRSSATEKPSKSPRLQLSNESNSSEQTPVIEMNAHAPRKKRKSLRKDQHHNKRISKSENCPEITPTGDSQISGIGEKKVKELRDDESKARCFEMSKNEKDKQTVKSSLNMHESAPSKLPQTLKQDEESEPSRLKTKNEKRDSLRAKKKVKSQSNIQGVKCDETPHPSCVNGSRGRQATLTKPQADESADSNDVKGRHGEQNLTKYKLKSIKSRENLDDSINDDWNLLDVNNRNTNIQVRNKCQKSNDISRHLTASDKQHGVDNLPMMDNRSHFNNDTHSKDDSLPMEDIDLNLDNAEYFEDDKRLKLDHDQHSLYNNDDGAYDETNYPQFSNNEKCESDELRQIDRNSNSMSDDEHFEVDNQRRIGENHEYLVKESHGLAVKPRGGSFKNRHVANEGKQLIKGGSHSVRDPAGLADKHYRGSYIDRSSVSGNSHSVNAERNFTKNVRHSAVENGHLVPHNKTLSDCDRRSEEKNQRLADDKTNRNSKPLMAGSSGISNGHSASIVATEMPLTRHNDLSAEQENRFGLMQTVAAKNGNRRTASAREYKARKKEQRDRRFAGGRPVNEINIDTAIEMREANELKQRQDITDSGVLYGRRNSSGYSEDTTSNDKTRPLTGLMPTTDNGKRVGAVEKQHLPTPEYRDRPSVDVPKKMEAGDVDDEANSSGSDTENSDTSGEERKGLGFKAKFLRMIKKLRPGSETSSSSDDSSNDEEEDDCGLQRSKSMSQVDMRTGRETVKSKSVRPPTDIEMEFTKSAIQMRNVFSRVRSRSFSNVAPRTDTATSVSQKSSEGKNKSKFHRSMEKFFQRQATSSESSEDDSSNETDKDSSDDDSDESENIDDPKSTGLIKSSTSVQKEKINENPVGRFVSPARTLHARNATDGSSIESSPKPRLKRLGSIKNLLSKLKIKAKKSETSSTGSSEDDSSEEDSSDEKSSNSKSSVEQQQEIQLKEASGEYNLAKRRGAMCEGASLSTQEHLQFERKQSPSYGGRLASSKNQADAAQNIGARDQMNAPQRRTSSYNDSTRRIEKSQREVTRDSSIKQHLSDTSFPHKDERIENDLSQDPSTDRSSSSQSSIHDELIVQHDVLDDRYGDQASTRQYSSTRDEENAGTETLQFDGSSNRDSPRQNSSFEAEEQQNEDSYDIRFGTRVVYRKDNLRDELPKSHSGIEDEEIICDSDDVDDSLSSSPVCMAEDHLQNFAQKRRVPEPELETEHHYISPTQISTRAQQQQNQVQRQATEFEGTISADLKPETESGQSVSGTDQYHRVMRAKSFNRTSSPVACGYSSTEDNSAELLPNRKTSASRSEDERVERSAGDFDSSSPSERAAPVKAEKSDNSKVIQQIAPPTAGKLKKVEKHGKVTAQNQDEMETPKSSPLSTDHLIVSAYKRAHDEDHVNAELDETAEAKNAAADNLKSSKEGSFYLKNMGANNYIVPNKSVQQIRPLVPRKRSPWENNDVSKPKIMRELSGTTQTKMKLPTKNDVKIAGANKISAARSEESEIKSCDRSLDLMDDEEPPVEKLTLRLEIEDSPDKIREISSEVGKFKTHLEQTYLADDNSLEAVEMHQEDTEEIIEASLLMPVVSETTDDELRRQMSFLRFMNDHKNEKPESNSSSDGFVCSDLDFDTKTTQEFEKLYRDATIGHKSSQSPQNKHSITDTKKVYKIIEDLQWQKSDEHGKRRRNERESPRKEEPLSMRDNEDNKKSVTARRVHKPLVGASSSSTVRSRDRSPSHWNYSLTLTKSRSSSRASGEENTTGLDLDTSKRSLHTSYSSSTTEYPRSRFQLVPVRQTNRHTGSALSNSKLNTAGVDEKRSNTSSRSSSKVEIPRENGSKVNKPVTPLIPQESRMPDEIPVTNEFIITDSASGEIKRVVEASSGTMKTDNPKKISHKPSYTAECRLGDSRSPVTSSQTRNKSDLTKFMNSFATSEPDATLNKLDALKPKEGTFAQNKFEHQNSKKSLEKPIPIHVPQSSLEFRGGNMELNERKSSRLNSNKVQGYKLRQQNEPEISSVNCSSVIEFQRNHRKEFDDYSVLPSMRETFQNRTTASQISKLLIPTPYIGKRSTGTEKTPSSNDLENAHVQHSFSENSDEDPEQHNYSNSSGESSKLDTLATSFKNVNLSPKPLVSSEEVHTTSMLSANSEIILPTPSASTVKVHSLPSPTKNSKISSWMMETLNECADSWEPSFSVSFESEKPTESIFSKEEITVAENCKENNDATSTVETKHEEPGGHSAVHLPLHPVESLKGEIKKEKTCTEEMRVTDQSDDQQKCELLLKIQQQEKMLEDQQKRLEFLENAAKLQILSTVSSANRVIDDEKNQETSKLPPCVKLADSSEACNMITQPTRPALNVNAEDSKPKENKSVPTDAKSQLPLTFIKSTYASPYDTLRQAQQRLRDHRAPLKSKELLAKHFANLSHSQSSGSVNKGVGDIPAHGKDDKKQASSGQNEGVDVAHAPGKDDDIKQASGSGRMPDKQTTSSDNTEVSDILSSRDKVNERQALRESIPTFTLTTPQSLKLPQTSTRAGTTPASQTSSPRTNSVPQTFTVPRTTPVTQTFTVPRTTSASQTFTVPRTTPVPQTFTVPRTPPVPQTFAVPRATPASQTSSPRTTPVPQTTNVVTTAAGPHPLTSMLPATEKAGKPTTTKRSKSVHWGQGAAKATVENVSSSSSPSSTPPLSPTTFSGKFKARPAGLGVQDPNLGRQPPSLVSIKTLTIERETPQKVMLIPRSLNAIKETEGNHSDAATLPPTLTEEDLSPSSPPPLPETSPPPLPSSAPPSFPPYAGGKFSKA